MMSSILTVVDALLCMLVIGAALEYLRAASLLDHPVLSLSFYLVAIGSFGILLDLFHGALVPGWSVLLHLGIVTYAWGRRQYIFSSDTSWRGAERRKAGRP
ncbi:hypothetical protein HX866_03975 [Pseudomonas gingeri]|uniref:hypothetical protein n=1 Tax=Pseudomonas gingeri TaxID=117681 RepID=UPI0015A43548|nr:hypothetical protein [Pseudomonas gingeri]NWA24040.1 hypothetical protein [Pseudomonas gingeri]